MIHKIEILLVLTAIVLLTLFSASFADPSAVANRYDHQTAFYGRNILIEPNTSEAIGQIATSTENSPNIDAYFWGVPDFSHQ